MVTPLQSIRLQSSQFLLKALKETEQQAQSGSSNARTAVLQRYGIDTSSSSSRSQTTLSALLDALSSKTTADTTTDETTTAETAETLISKDVTTASFMAGLKQQLKDMADVPATSAQAKSLLAALETGTLAVTDPLKGVTVKAWDVESATEKDTVGKTGDTIETTGWSDFLKSHLTRGETAAFVKTAEGSYLDKTTGNSAFFGTVGSTYVYLSWPQVTTAA